jgi:succinate-semialdehyde dehydrogenase/glutarate-semialdehyde dehydrogenase
MSELVSANPATGEVLQRVPAHGPAEIEARLAAAEAAFRTWRATPQAKRADQLRRVAARLEATREPLARLMTLEMGKPIQAARAEVDKCAAACRHYADAADDYLAPEAIEGGGGRLIFQPLGPILAVMPWNFPLWQVIRFAAPALLAGNVALLKHASNVPQCAIALEAVFREAGTPPGVFSALLVGAAAVEGLIADRRVAAVTVTGSEAAGRAVAAAAGRHLKRSVLELGGSDPFIVLPTADLDRAVATAVRARLINNGQSCIAAKRFIVADAVYDRFRDGFVAAMRGLRIGDPLDEHTELGPLATAAIRRELHAQVERTVALGARVALGGHPRPGAGHFYAPTVLEAVPRDAPAAREELFGPVAALFEVAGFAEAIALANDTRFGLGASVWTTDPEEAARAAEALEVGTVSVNEMVVSDPRFPFGGIKDSGYGRELGLAGLREFVNVKTVRGLG